MGLTLLASAFLAVDLSTTFASLVARGEVGRSLEQAAFTLIVAAMLYGNLIYQVARLGHFKRRGKHEPADRNNLITRYADAAPPVAILIPSYREEGHVVRQTLLSAALQEYPNRRVVLLIDDPPEGGNPQATALLETARRLPGEIRDLLEKPARHFESALENYRERLLQGTSDPRDETQLLATLHAEATEWLELQARNERLRDHTDQQFAEMVFRRPASVHFDRVLELEDAVRRGKHLDAAATIHEYGWLASRFRVELTSFERKRYFNLSHEPNKAMNLNSYLGLMGDSYRIADRDGNLHFEAAGPEEEGVEIPGAEFVITLDADSLLTADYALRLVDVMERPGNERVAVVQTPYSAIPGASHSLERIAGATTDIQYIIHQGFTNHQATYWVGANALLRTAALRDIRSIGFERGFEFSRFIQDRTVIEDTESSIDLIERGWTLYNYPARMAYSATPPDYGALAVQRHRWANGGLIILPKLLRHVGRGSWSPGRLAEALVRIHYLTSIACVNLGLLLLLLYPFEHSLRMAWLPIAALPYFILYARDLTQIGYRAGDMVRAYALNLLLLPVNLAGVFSSLRQAVTGSKSRFVRTPKVASRTEVPPFYIGATYALLAAVSALIIFDVAKERWLHACFGLINGSLLGYALVRFIGVRESLSDLFLSYEGSSD